MRKLFSKCPKCKTTHFINFYANKNFICPNCGYHFQMSPVERIKLLTKPKKSTEHFKNLRNIDPLLFQGYKMKLKKAYRTSGNKSGVKVVTSQIGQHEVVLAVMDTNFMMGSMGAVVGEKITRAIELATKEKLPLIIVSGSGGARMQEGVISLMQMAKTSAALKRFSDAGLLFISLLTHPTTGGVSASFSFLGDIIIAEPDALIGFAGPRVIRQTIGAKLPDGFQRSEFLLEKGMIDAILLRDDLKNTLEKILDLHHQNDTNWECKMGEDLNNFHQKYSIMETVSLAREIKRPKTADYIDLIFSDFVELHGDRKFGDDHAMIGGIASFQGIPVTIIGQQKGKKTTENVYRHFGMAHPEGYRKALRLMKQAEKFGRPIINLIDTPGAYPGIGAEERGQAEAIAVNLREMSGLKVPIISIVTGEGGSGGALGIGVTDKILMLKNAIYSVISPEGCASILWKDSSRSKEAAESLKISAFDLLKMNLIDEIINEPDEGAHTDYKLTAKNISAAIKRNLACLLTMNIQELLEQRYQKYRSIEFYKEK
ncbi:MAG: acetyl-CoA carboxylase carboxyltransferase subunit alpha [Candidatus Cloacimonadota bacterium]|nr:acetyl-CoA carboxylase carboxyltransferase subunit alpha [Candidatus Cloacimonadota bacterium]